MTSREEDIRKAIERIEANIDRARIQKSWRYLDENTIEEHIEIRLRHELKGDE